MSFRVQQRPCATCIYRPESPLDLAKLEEEIRDSHMADFFRSYRICHHSDDVCCAGFFARHKNAFTLGQLAQRLGMIAYVAIDTLSARPERTNTGVTPGRTGAPSPCA